MQTPAPAPTPSTLPTTATFLGHPIGLFLLFLVEMWERFSYYGMRGLLVLYLITVIAPKELRPGSYENAVRIAEVRDNSGGPVEISIERRVPLRVVVGASSTLSAPAATAANGEARLRIERGDVDSNGAWISSTQDPFGPVIATGEPGRAFQNAVTKYRITNPTDEPISVQIEVIRDPNTKNAYFTANDSSGLSTVKIRPDSSIEREQDKFILVVAMNEYESGRNWTSAEANTLYGWYTGLAYLFPILGGLLADKLIGTHRSMLVGGILIAIGHVILGVSGLGELARNDLGMTFFLLGLAVIVLGTGFFKPTVSVMVGQLYPPGDSRRDGAFTIFYMGINLGAFLCAFIVGTLGETVSWHWGFGAAAVGMLLGLGLYIIGRPMFLCGIGGPPIKNADSASVLMFIGSLVIAGLFALLCHFGALTSLGAIIAKLQANPPAAYAVMGVLGAGILGWVAWFVATNDPADRGPVLSIFIFMLFNAFFWIAFEQAGSSLNVFTKENSDRTLLGWEVPTTWFQSVNAGLIFMLAPLFAGIWTWLGRRMANPAQPLKIGLGLLFLGLGYVFMVFAGKIASEGVKASMFFILATYFWHTVGELCLSPTGLSYVTKAAPAKFVSLLMGIWFVSSFIANLGGGLVAAQVEAIERGEIRLPWSIGGKADFFMLFVATSVGAGLLIIVLTPLLKKLMRSATD
jgi:POT family proton-dependent oligopeptide transporter